MSKSPPYARPLPAPGLDIDRCIIASFSSASTHMYHVTQWPNYLSQRAEILTRRWNLTPQRAKNPVYEWFVCGTEVAFDIKQVGFSFFSFRNQQAVVGSLLRMKAFLPNTSLLLNMISWSRTWSISWHLDPFRANRQNCSHNRAAKHIKISCFPRESSQNHS